ncbi:MAG: alpha/beta hydrolase [Candidatus Thorarchaeota archaeon]
MSYLEVSKVHPQLGKLLENDFKLQLKAGEDFAKKNGVSLEVITSMQCDWDLILKYNRHIAAALDLERAKRIPENVAFEIVNTRGVQSEWIYVPQASEEKIFFHLFGGGYIMGTLPTRRWSSYLYSRQCKMRVLNVGYRLAPEHPYPAALKDSLNAYHWLLDLGINPKNIIICGESAGGGLTMATMLKLRELELPLPAAAVMQSPWVDLRARGKSLKKYYNYEPELAVGVKPMARVYANRENLKNPFISPVYADLHDLSPLLIQAGSIEVLLDDSILLADRAKEAGVDVTLEVYEGMTHVFQSFADDLEESIKAWKSIGDFVQDHLKFQVKDTIEQSKIV